MHIAYYMPMKPHDHPVPSGDRIIGAGIRDFLISRGHTVTTASRFITRHLPVRPWRWPLALAERMAAQLKLQKAKPDLWLTYHSYYKAPDIFGPAISRALGIPYVIMQGLYATKYRKRIATWAGFQLNTHALQSADFHFSNKLRDDTQLARLIPASKRMYIKPGLHPGDFERDEIGRERIRRMYGLGDDPVVMATAMFRADVKTQGLKKTIEACGKLFSKGIPVHLLLAGDGPRRAELEQHARQHLPERTIFLGCVPRTELPTYLSAADCFAFPGINESLGMAYLEAQSCGVPVVAYDGWGVPEAVKNGETGLLIPPHDDTAYEAAIERIVANPGFGRQLGSTAAAHIRSEHDLDRNYGIMEEQLLNVCSANTTR